MRLFTKTRTHLRGVGVLVKLRTKLTCRVLHRNRSLRQLTRVRRGRLTTLNRNANLRRRLYHLKGNRRVTGGSTINGNGEPTVNGLPLGRQGRQTIKTRRVTGACHRGNYNEATLRPLGRRLARTLKNARRINKVSHLINERRCRFVHPVKNNNADCIMNTRGIILSHLIKTVLRRQRVLIYHHIRRSLKAMTIG